MNWLRRNLTVEPVLFFYMLGSFLQYLALQQLLLEKVCFQEVNDTVICANLSAYKDEEETVQKRTSYWLIVLNLALTVPSVISTLVLGAWTDRVGRRVAMVLPSLGAVINGVCLIFSAIYLELSVGIMILGSVIMGVLGAYGTILAAVFSYLGDITKERTRTRRFGFLEAMTFTGSFVGLLTCGIVIDNLGYVAAFIYYICCNTVVVLYTLLWLRESSSYAVSQGLYTSKPTNDALQSGETDPGGTNEVFPKLDEERGWSCKISCLQLCQLQSLGKSFITVGRERPNKQRVQLILLLICLFTFQLVGTGENDTTVLYLKKAPLSFTSSQISYYSGSKSGLQSLMLFTLMPLLHLCGVHDCFIALGGLCFRMSGYVVFGLARTLWQVFTVPFLLSPAGLPAATTRAMMSKIVVSSEQGSLFALTASLEMITGLLASLIFNALYPATIDIIGGGLVFILMAAILILPALLLIVIWRIQKLTIAYVEYNEGNATNIYGDT
ncbi:proton-coupled folate transporter-like isoform X2 [Lytechinus pictus]|uniref:proton-coupled folate transporter-like isoform X2 n=1 Tax=Lytechinus pictus TaxID=7653 RepID=UPI0030B9AE0D